jgi:hypothetical protein
MGDLDRQRHTARHKVLRGKHGTGICACSTKEDLIGSLLATATRNKTDQLTNWKELEQRVGLHS